MRKYKSLILGTAVGFAAFLALPGCSSDSEEAPPPESSSGGGSGGSTEAEIELCMELCGGDAACKQDCQ